MSNEQGIEGERANFYKNQGIYYILPESAFSGFLFML